MTVTAIHIASEYGADVRPVTEAEAVAGKGLMGDRYFGTTRQVTIVCRGELDRAAADLGGDAIPAGATRRNITVDLDELPRTHGTPLRIGEVELQVWRECTPCQVMETSVGPGARAALEDRAGISATVVTGGTIRVGDPIVVG